MTIISTLILGIIEGLTEFFPISSTGHLIIAEKVLGIHNPSLFFNVSIQLGAILAACFYYRVRIIQILHDAVHHMSAKSMATYLFIATLPALVFGAAFHSVIESLQKSTLVVSITTIGVALFFIYIQKTYGKSAQKDGGSKKQSILDYIVIGLFQAFAIIPGVSRSGITISGALTRKFSFKEATDTAFILAIPVMMSATAYEFLKLIKQGTHVQTDIMIYTLIGGIVAFFTALATISITVPLLKRYGFTPFIIYRIILGILVILLLR